MFNEKDRIKLFVKMIMAKDREDKQKILEKLQKLQKSDFIGILKAMEGYKVTIRLLDPPLHEFLPTSKDKKVLARAKELEEVNPMMGHRGVRLGITSPEIYEMQIKAVNEIQRIIDEIEQGPENIRKIIVLQAPTGTGKSWISAALALKYGASILTKTQKLKLEMLLPTYKVQCFVKVD